MTTLDVPGWGGYLALRAARAANRPKKRNANRARTLYQSIVRFTLHAAGFSLLTFGGFTLSMLAGLITAGLSCFVMSWLMAPAEQPADDQAR